MKFAKKLSLIALAAVLFTSCKDTSKDGNLETPKEEIVTDSTQKKETAANFETATFKIEGMTCPMGCAATIQDKLAHMEGVDDAKVDFDSKTATISFDPAKQTADSFVQTVEKIAGGIYKVSDVKSSGDKAFYSVEQEKEKAKTAKKEAAATGKKGAKPSCCSADAKADKKAGCCADKKETKGGNL